MSWQEPEKKWSGRRGRWRSYGITIDKIELPRVTMTVSCSKGTYIRTLCHDIGRALGCGGCMEHLLRTQVERFQVKDSLTLHQIEQLRDDGRLETVMIPVEEMFSEYQKVKTLAEYDYLVHNGNQVKEEHLQVLENICLEQPVRLYDSRGQFIGIYQYRKERRWFQPQKMFLGGQ